MNSLSNEYDVDDIIGKLMNITRYDFLFKIESSNK